ncbi:uncharacterized protein A1O9_12347 [Exophiala aquamarina CBS 119918]|uniref:Major facilitator superfamily (MFS) profile domain-containing protein n=1 Tax=Exophiala aquamarina CBS 119918 TaxID=1182545 RepID=A0A072NWC9_9EURO|nr:uncharacterized protein A1O9_12347 [Exophiala aquamarina CBS 119918]KEF51712.1 hypothetical protein A1O9_12347 [Exophiala aquamarina CBS 119918]
MTILRSSYDHSRFEVAHATIGNANIRSDFITAPTQSLDIASDKQPTAALEKPADVQHEFEISSQVAGEDESFPSNQGAHHDKALTRKLLWKLDSRIVPILAVLFLYSFLDRTNVGNAKILGLEKD